MRLTCYLNVRKQLVNRGTVSSPKFKDEYQVSTISGPNQASGQSRVIKLNLELPDDYLDGDEVTIDLTGRDLDTKITNAVDDLKQMGA